MFLLQFYLKYVLNVSCVSMFYTLYFKSVDASLDLQLSWILIKAAYFSVVYTMSL